MSNAASRVVHRPTITAIRRGPTGHPRGEHHHRARYADSVVEQARILAERGMSRMGIARYLGVNYYTLGDWLKDRTR